MLPSLLLTAAGSVHGAEIEGGPPLGTGTGAQFVAESLPVPPGTTVVLYSDGLVESRSTDLDVGTERLACALAAASGDFESLCDEVVRSVAPSGTDDVTILALRRLLPRS